MKILCFILSFYVLVLSTFPCCAEDYCNDEIKTEHSNNHSQDHKDTDCNGCSPFITCGTCFGFTLSNTAYNFQLLTTFVEKQINLCQQNYVENYFAEIWNPPKIS